MSVCDGGGRGRGVCSTHSLRCRLGRLIKETPRDRVESAAQRRVRQGPALGTPSWVQYSRYL